MNNSDRGSFLSNLGMLESTSTEVNSSLDYIDSIHDEDKQAKAFRIRQE